MSERIETEIEHAYWDFARRQDKTQVELPASERDAFKAAVREMFFKIQVFDGRVFK